MPNRFQNNTRAWIYRFLVYRDGGHCLICGLKPSQESKLEIDHADGNPNNNQSENLHLLCSKCNQEMRLKSPRQHAQIISNHRAKNVRECESEIENLKMNKQIFEYENGSSEMKANNCYEVKFRDWIIEHINKFGFMSKKEAINSGAEYVGCSPITTLRYLDKLTSFQGILIARKESNQIIITLRNIKI